MSTVQTPPAEAPAPAPAPPAQRESALAKIGASLTAGLCLAAIAILAWPASEADKARDDGERTGQAISDLYYADSTSEVETALDELSVAVADTRQHAGDEVAEQIDEQADALDRAADGFVGSRTADDSFEADVYQAELDVALDDLERSAADFRDQGPEVEQAYWEGLESELPDSDE